MQIWMSNTRSNRAYEREFFALICDNLVFRQGSRRASERFQSLLALASLPWLDQPRFLEPTRLIFEIHDAWDELWTLRPRDLVGGTALEQAIQSAPRPRGKGADRDQTFGRYLARPLHELAVFAASGGAGARLRVGTNRQLIVEAQRLGAWRVIRGGAAR